MNSATVQTPAISETDHPHRSMWSSGLRAGAVAGVAAELFAGGGRVIGVPMRAGGVGAGEAQSLPPGWVVLATTVCAVLGLGLAIALRTFAPTPRRAFIASSTALTLLSFVSPVAAGDTTLATKLTLGFTHLIAAAVVIPAIAKALPVVRER